MRVQGWIHLVWVKAAACGQTDFVTRSPDCCDAAMRVDAGCVRQASRQGPPDACVPPLCVLAHAACTYKLLSTFGARAEADFEIARAQTRKNARFQLHSPLKAPLQFALRGLSVLVMVIFAAVRVVFVRHCRPAVADHFDPLNNTPPTGFDHPLPAY